MARRSPGAVRDAILQTLRASKGPQTIDEIHEGVTAVLGSDVPRSSVRSYLGINTPGKFERVSRGRYVLNVSKK